MKYQSLNIPRWFYLSFLSFFGLGFSPKAPGTVGSLGTLPLILLLSIVNISFQQLVAFILILFLLSCFVADYAQLKEQVHDPGWIVIDEVIGMLITWLFVFPKIDFLHLLLVFIFFRIFDIVKIFPASWFDKKMHNGAGTIIDDVISALYAGFLLKIVDFFHLLS